MTSSNYFKYGAIIALIALIIIYNFTVIKPVLLILILLAITVLVYKIKTTPDKTNISNLNIIGIFLVLLLVTYFVYSSSISTQIIYEPKTIEETIAYSTGSNESIKTISIKNIGRDSLNTQLVIEGNKIIDAGLLANELKDINNKIKNSTEKIITPYNCTLIDSLSKSTLLINSSLFNIKTLVKEINPNNINNESMHNDILENQTLIGSELGRMNGMVQNKSISDILNHTGIMINDSKNLTNIEIIERELGNVSKMVEIINSDANSIDKSVSNISEIVKNIDKEIEYLDSSLSNSSAIIGNISMEINNLNRNLTSIEQIAQKENLSNILSQTEVLKKEIDLINSSINRESSIYISFSPLSIIDSGETKFVSAKIDTSMATISGKYRGAIIIQANDKKLYEAIPLAFKIKGANDDTAKPKSDENGTNKSYNINLNVNGTLRR